MSEFCWLFVREGQDICLDLEADGNDPFSSVEWEQLRLTPQVPREEN